MDKKIHVSKFFVTAPGDSSVGIFPQTWTVEPDFYFPDQKDLDKFKDELRYAFEYLGEGCYVETAEEIAAQEELDILMTEQMLEDLDDDMSAGDMFDDHKIRKMRDDD